MKVSFEFSLFNRAEKESTQSENPSPSSRTDPPKQYRPASMPRLRLNLLLFGAMNLLVVGSLIYLILRIFTPELIEDHGEFIVGSLLGSLGTAIAGTAGYAMAGMQALTKDDSGSNGTGKED